MFELVLLEFLSCDAEKCLTRNPTLRGSGSGFGCGSSFGCGPGSGSLALALCPSSFLALWISLSHFGPPRYAAITSSKVTT